MTRVSRGSQSPIQLGGHFTCYCYQLSPGTCSEWCVYNCYIQTSPFFSVLKLFVEEILIAINVWICLFASFFVQFFKAEFIVSFFRILNCVSHKIYLIATHSKPQGIYHDHFTCILYSFYIHVED